MNIDDRIFLMGGPRGMLTFHVCNMDVMQIVDNIDGTRQIIYDRHVYARDLDVHSIYWYVKGENDDKAP